MAKSIIERLVGDLEEKRTWRRLNKRVKSLPKDFRYAFKKILHYFYNTGFDMDMIAGLIDLFEESAADGKPVLSIVGKDVTGFCDELIKVNNVDTIISRDKLNQEIHQYFHKEEK